MKMKSLLLIGIVFFFVGEGLSEEIDLSKENVGKALEAYMTVNLNASNTPFHEALADVVKQDEPISHIVMDVLTKDRDLSLTNPTNLRILFLALEGVGDLTEKTRWRSKYFKLTITSSNTTHRDYLFLTVDCREFKKILNTRGKTKAAAFGLSLAGDAFNRAEQIPFEDW